MAIPEVQAIIPLAKHETWVEFGGDISSGSSLVDAHHGWTLAGLRSVRAPKAEWCNSYDTLCPSGLSLLGICCADRLAYGMGSHFQFEGHFLSLLVDLDKGTVWDARIDVAF